MKSVSILVPFYGAERYIVQCARSLFSQSYAQCEFIFVDDASTDRGLVKLKQTAHEFEHLSSRIKIIECTQNGGVATARNIALDAATGDYILFVDSDDWVDSQIIEKLMRRSEAKSADICNAWCESVAADDSRRVCPEGWISPRRAHIKALIGQSHIVPNHVRGMLFRRSLFEDNSLRFTPGVDFGEDYSLLPQILYYSQRLATLSEPLYYYRVENEGSYMNNISQRHINSYVKAQGVVRSFIESLPDAAKYSNSLLLGQLNIKKWIFRRGENPSLYDAELFGTTKKTIYHPLLWLYNRVIDSRSASLIKLFSIIINLPLYLRAKIYR